MANGGEKDLGIPPNAFNAGFTLPKFNIAPEK